MPDIVPILKTIPFVGASEKAGSELKFPILVSREHGFTALGQNGANSSLRAATVAQSRVARVLSYGFMGRTQIDNLSISRATGNEQSFIQALEYKIKNLQDSFAVQQEQMLSYGQSGLGVVTASASVTVGGTTFTNGISGTKIKINTSDFADSIWIGSEGMPIELYSTNSSNTVALSTTIISYDTDNEWIEVESLGGLTNVLSYVIYRAGFKGNEGPGLLRILQQSASSANIFEVESSPLWRVNQYSAASAYLSYEMVAEAVARAIGRGLAKKLTLHVHPIVFAGLAPDFNTVKATGADFKSRVFTSQSEVKKLEHGMIGLVFYVCGVEVEVVCNPFVRKGYGFGVADGEFMRAGSSDISYDMPGEESGKYFHRLENTAALEMRVFADQTLFSKSLNKHLLISNILVDAPSA
jgi:hypothetical protein